ncbi:MAG: hypothetical protein FJ288_08995 [Planctomycetes bacterium]|nr:hypothetical protein [Planctomycetota bacterium]
MAKQTTKTTLAEELLALAQRHERRYTKAKADLLEAVQTNPAEALAWHGEEMAKVQEPHERTMHVAALLKEHAPHEVLADIQQEVERGIERFFGGNSTSQFQNAVARARTEGLVALKRDLDGLARQYKA